MLRALGAAPDVDGLEVAVVLARLPAELDARRHVAVDAPGIAAAGSVRCRQAGRAAELVGAAAHLVAAGGLLDQPAALVVVLALHDVHVQQIERHGRVRHELESVAVERRRRVEQPRIVDPHLRGASARALWRAVVLAGVAAGCAEAAQVRRREIQRGLDVLAAVHVVPAAALLFLAVRQAKAPD